MREQNYICFPGTTCMTCQIKHSIPGCLESEIECRPTDDCLKNDHITISETSVNFILLFFTIVIVLYFKIRSIKLI